MKAAVLTGLAGDRVYGGNARIQAQFSRGVPCPISVITYGAPVLSNANGTSESFRIPTRFRGDVPAAMEATYSDGTNAGPATWTPYQQFRVAFSPDYTKNVIVLPSRRTT